MELKKRKVVIFLVSLVTSLIVLAIGLSIYTANNNKHLGISAVKLLYQFNTPEDLPKQFIQLKAYLSDEAYEQLDFGNELRVVNTYYKFKCEPTRVVIKKAESGHIEYILMNPNISEDQIWIFNYSIDSEGKLTDIKEYKTVQSKSSTYFNDEYYG